VKDEELFVIYCVERAMYWNSSNRGYTNLKSDAGIYIQSDADRICKAANLLKREEFKILHDEAPEFSGNVIDSMFDSMFERMKLDIGLTDDDRKYVTIGGRGCNKNIGSC
jgi:hypothetical protein